MGLRVVPGGRASVRQTIGDILSTANVVTAAAGADGEPSQDVLGEPPPPLQAGPNEIASGAKI